MYRPNNFPGANEIAAKSRIIKCLRDEIIKCANEGKEYVIFPVVKCSSWYHSDDMAALSTDPRFLREQIRPVFSDAGYTVEFHNVQHEGWTICVDISSGAWFGSRTKNAEFCSPVFDSIYREDYWQGINEIPRWNKNGHMLDKYCYHHYSWEGNWNIECKGWDDSEPETEIAIEVEEE